jgi:hypothetical protein
VSEPEQQFRDDGVVCPHCGQFNRFEFCDGDGRLVTYWGDGGPHEYECQDCERVFFVREYVIRNFEAGKTKEVAR